MPWITTRPSLLVRVKDTADHAAWAEFNQCYGELIVRYCLACGLSFADAQDVRQTVLMSLMRAMGGFDYQPSRGRFRSYLGRVVRNAIARNRRCPAGGRVALLEESVLSRVAADEGDADERWHQEWRTHHLRRAMRAIRRTHDPQTLAVFDRLLAGRSTGEVAGEFDMSIEAVRKVKQRVRSRLRDVIAGQLADEEAHA